MVLSDMGEIANRFWREIPNHFPFVRLDEFVIMPNHVHGIIVIDKSKMASFVESGMTDNSVAPIIVETPKLGVSTATGSNAGNKTHWKPGNIGVIINQYKRICTIQSRKTNPGFAWQPRFHDHIVRNNDELNRIREYIVNNPANWANDDLQFQNGNPISLTGTA
jgi:putative transposase